MDEKILNAQSNYNAGKIELAMKLYMDIIQSDSTNALAYQGLAQCKFNNKEYEASIIASHKAEELDPTLYFPHIILAYIYWSRKQYSDCEIELNQAIEKAPMVIDPYISLGKLLFFLKRYNESAVVLVKAIEIEPYSWNCLLLLGEVHVKLNKPKDAIRELRLSYKLHPSISTAYRIFSIFAYKNFLWSLISFVILFTLALFAPIGYSIPAVIIIGAFLIFVAINFMQIKDTLKWISALVFLSIIIMGFISFHR